MALSIQTLSFSKSVTAPLNPLLPKPNKAKQPLVIRMGGGPRTYPGGVSKWQWKRMQAKKAKQLLKARLCRERQIYEMRKRSELRAAVSELERPWEVVERPPNLFSVSADEQLKVLADRFQKPGGFDLWTENDGPQLFHTPDQLPSARFFPKGVVHSVKPYRRVSESGELDGEDEDYGESNGELSDVESLNSKISSVLRRKGNRRNFGALDSNGLAISDSEQLRFEELDLEAGNHGQLEEERNWNRKSYGRKFNDRSRSFSGREIQNVESSEPESFNLKNSSGYRRKGNRRTLRSSDLNDSSWSVPEQLSLDELDLESGNHGQLGEQKNLSDRRSYGRKFGGRSRSFSGGEIDIGKLSEPESLNSKRSFGSRSRGNMRRFRSSHSKGSGGSNSEQFDFGRKQRGKGLNFRRSRGNGSSTMNGTEDGVYDMNLQLDGSYGLQ